MDNDRTYFETDKKASNLLDTNQIPIEKIYSKNII